jgi:nucleotide-binding universal stress UspA family protein
MTGGTLDRVAPPAAATTGRRVKPVMLLTLNVELEESAISFAIDSAAQTGAELYICDAIPLEYRNYVGHVARQYAEQINRKHLDAVARRARESGVTTSQLAFHSPRPVKIALEVARDEQIGLLVFGANRKGLGKRYFRKAIKRIRADAPCLVWVDDAD